MSKNKKYKKIMAVTMCGALAAGMVLSVYADEAAVKDENVYVNLNGDGSVADVYVVNEYMLDADTDIVDYGEYSSVENLSSEEEIIKKGDKVTVEADQGKFIYQGSLENAVLPWIISISYTLDGKKVTAEELAGADGKLEIHVDIKENPDSDDTFFDNYLMQATVTLNTDYCSDIIADGATQANVGTDRQLLYNIMAGQEKEFTIKADVTDFEMTAISFQAVPMSFAIDSDAIDKEGLAEKTDEIKDAAEAFDDGAKALDDGTGKLLGGAAELKKGTDELFSGTLVLERGFGSLTEGSTALKTGTEELSGSLEQMQQGAGELKSGLNALTANSPELTEGSAEVKAALQQIQSSLNSIETGTEQMQVLLDSSAQILAGIEQAEAGAGQVAGGLGVIQGSYGNVNDLKSANSNAAAYLNGLVDQVNVVLGSLPGETVEQIAAMGGIDINGTISTVSGIAALLEQDNDALGNFQGGVDQAAAGASEVNAGLATLSSQYKQFDEQVQSLPVILESMVTDEMQPLKDAINQLTKEYESLDTGLNSYMEGVSGIQSSYDTLNAALGQAAAGADALAEGAGNLAAGNVSLSSGASGLIVGTQKLQAGASEVVDGLSELKDGTGELLDGTGEFSEQVSGIDEKIEEEIDKAVEEIAGGDFEAVSFVSEKNKNIGLVQFVMQTEAISVPEETEEEPAEKEESVWDKIKNLF